MQVCDVGGGTGFCTLGVVETVRPENITLVDQSPHQLTKAKAKPALQKVTITEVYILAAAGILRLFLVCLSCLETASHSAFTSSYSYPYSIINIHVTV